MALRKAMPGAVLDSDVLGPVIELRADEHGVVRPQTSDQVRLADALHLPVIHDE